MPAPVHLVTMVGGLGVDILPHMLRHYQALGIRSFFVVVHTPEPDEAFVAHVSGLAASCGVQIESVITTPHYKSCGDRVFTRIMDAHPNDWFLPVDYDELHQYPDDLSSMLAFCERRGYDYLRGCFVDRLSADGTLAPLRPDQPLWTQYPLGGMLTFSILRGDPRKVVAAKSHVRFRSFGRHEAACGLGCPSQEVLVPVHHFKWVDTLLPYIEQRREMIKRFQLEHLSESDRLVAYFVEHGRVDLGDERLLIGPCTPDYPHWGRVIRRAIEHERESARALESAL